MSCEARYELLSALLDGELSRHERTELESHVSACTRCRGRLAELRALARAVAPARATAAPATLRGQIEAALPGIVRARRRRWPLVVALVTAAATGALAATWLRPARREVVVVERRLHAFNPPTGTTEAPAPHERLSAPEGSPIVTVGSKGSSPSQAAAPAVDAGPTSRDARPARNSLPTAPTPSPAPKAPPAAHSPTPRPRGAVIRGVVLLGPGVALSPAPAGCETSAAGRVGNALVRITSALPADWQVARPPARTHQLVLGPCGLSPRMLVVMAGDAAEFISTENTSVAHSARALVDGSLVRINLGFTSARPPPVLILGDAFVDRVGKILPRDQDQPLGYTFAASQPFAAATDGQGAFEIAGLPEGSLRLNVWHPTLGEREVTVETRFWKPAEVTVTFETAPLTPVWLPGEKGCRIAIGSTSPVARACAEGGIVRAKEVMKNLRRRAAVAGLKLDCDDCHRNDTTYDLTPDARAKFERMLRVLPEPAPDQIRR